MLIVIFHTQQGAFTPYHLYHDFQPTIKALFIDVTKEVLQRGRVDINVFLLGSNELEKLFGILRSLFIGRGFHLKGLGELIGATIEVHSIKQRNPNWDRGQRRLSATGSYDHTSLTSWEGKMYLEGSVGVVQSAQSARNNGMVLGLTSFGVHPYFGVKYHEGVTRV